MNTDFDKSFLTIKDQMVEWESLHELYPNGSQGSLYMKTIASLHRLNQKAVLNTKQGKVS